MKDLFFKTIMLKGEAGGTIASIEKTGSSLNVDTYTITLNDGETQTFEVTNGSSIASIEKTDTSGLLDTYTVTLTDGSTTQFVVRNGEDGAGYEVPAGSVLFYDPDGDDSAPEGYEASNDPNGAAIAALQRGVDNNLLLHGDLMNIKSANYTYGWSFEKDAGTNMPGVWAPVNGLMIMAGVRGTLTAPRLTSFSPFDEWFSSNTRFSVSILFTFIGYPSGDPAPEPYYIAKIENIDPANLEGAVYTLENRVEIEVTQLAFGGLFKLHINNLSSSSYDIAIRAVKLEIGTTATDIKYMTPQTGLEDAIAQYIDTCIVVEEKSSSFTAAATSSGNISIDIEKSGYTPIGIVGITGQNTSPLAYSDFYIESDTTAKVYYYNRGSSISITLVLRVLYKKS